MVTTGNLTVTFGYDAAGALAVKTVATTNTLTTTHYIGGYYERTVGGAARRYYRLGDQLVLREGTGPYQYLYGDHLNSATLTTNAAGAKTSETRYYPYGAHRYDWGSDPSDRDFTGQRRDAEIALLDYVARRYSPYLGRFVSPDSIIPNPGNPQDLNRYSYTRNNPIKYRDPSGHWVETAFDVISLGMTLNDIRNEGLTAWNAVSLVTDVASVALPIVPAAASHAIRAGKLASKAVTAMDSIADTAKLVDVADAAVDAAKLAKTVDTAGDITLAGATSSRATTILGENMRDRVIPFAEKTGARTLPWGTTPEKWTAMTPQERWRLNDGLLRKRIGEGDHFRYIGIDPDRSLDLRKRFNLTVLNYCVSKSVGYLTRQCR